MFEYYINYTLTYTLWSLITLFHDFCNEKRREKKIIKKNVLQYAEIYLKILSCVVTNLYILSAPGLLILPYMVNLADKEVTIFNTCTDLVLSYLISDFFFYILHRLFHTKYLYKYHNKHHQLNTPIGMGAFYMSGIDLYFGNLLPIIAGPILISATSLTVHIWIFITITNTIILSHTNYKNWSEFHDNHHVYRTCNYGIGGLMDYIFGTGYNPLNYIDKKTDDIKCTKVKPEINKELSFDNIYNIYNCVDEI